MSAVPPPTERLTFRRMVEGDLDDVAALLGDPVVMAHYPRPKTRDEAHAWIEWCRRGYARDGFGLWVIEDRDGRFVGDCGLTWQHLDGTDELEVGYHVVADRQGEGLGSEAAAACVDFARSRGVDRVVAIIRPANLASRRVAEKVGLELDRTSTMHGLEVVVHATR